MTKKHEAKGGNGDGSGEARSAFRIERRGNGVAIVWMDVPGAKMNTLSAGFADDFDAVFDELERASDVTSVVFASGKKDSFLAGADVTMLDAVKTADEATELSRRGQEALSRIAGFSKPVVAAIHGPCLGGGLEVALACHARVASDHPKTKLGLPEVQLGLLPAAGGTQRLPRAIGVQAALDMMLTGKQVDAKRARKMGIVDEVVRDAIVVDVAIEMAARLASEPKKQASLGERLGQLLDTDELTELALAENPIGRKVLFDQAKKELSKKTRGRYPAPEKILEAVRVGLERGFDEGLRVERTLFGALVVSPESAALRSIFFATTALKKDTGVDDPRIEAKPVKKIGIIGAGLMGGGIAHVTATHAKAHVRLKDKDDEGVLRGLRYVGDLVGERVSRRRLSNVDAERALSMVTGTTTWSGFADVEIVIEAVFEDLALKHRVLRECEAATGKRTIFASNTSSLPITKIAEASARPENVIGMHYFSPVHKMPLLEIIVTEKTADWVTATCVAFGKKQGKTVIVVRDGVGFYTTRILAPFMNEAAHVLSEGVAIERVDDALLDFGFPVGPIKLTDEVGIDVGAKVGKIMQEAFGARMTPPPGMDALLADERHGRKNARGFYRYEEGKKGARQVDESVYRVLGVKPDNAMPAQEIAERVTLQMVNEAARCFEEGILRSARDGDIGAIFGLGFPPFLGGPFRWVDSIGATQVVRMLERYRDRLGARFEPAPVLVDMAKRGASFHGEPQVATSEEAAAAPT
jgi:3-hydroxyacyl-CoA dehydrogenase/enoyl-CoA hydratase/3-hydroxybutyryl-CoA epimerase